MRYFTPDLQRRPPEEFNPAACVGLDARLIAECGRITGSNSCGRGQYYCSVYPIKQQDPSEALPNEPDALECLRGGSDGGSAFAVNWVRVCENSSGTLVEIVPLQVNKDLMTVNFDIFNTKSKAKFSGFQRRKCHICVAFVGISFSMFSGQL